MAASDIGVTPKLVYAEPFLNVIEFIDGRALRPEDLRDPERAAELVETLKTLHHGSHALRGTATYFWPFQVVRTYAHLGLDRNSRLSSELPEVMRIATVLEAQVAPFTPVLTDNDVVPQNVMLIARTGYGSLTGTMAATAIRCLTLPASPPTPMYPRRSKPK